MGMFSNIEKAKVSLGGNYLHAPSKGVAYVEVVKAPDNRKEKDLFIVELAILESNHAGDPAGSRRSWVVNLSDHEAALGNVKGFVQAANAVAEDDVTEAMCEAAVSPSNPLMGKVVEYETYTILTKKDKEAGKKDASQGSFTKHVWTGVDAETQAAAAELYKAAGFHAPTKAA